MCFGNKKSGTLYSFNHFHSLTMEEEEDNLEKLLKWAAELGISDSKNGGHSCLGHSLVVSYFHGAGGRGLGAARHLEKGELVLSVPKSALITTQALLLRDDRLSLAVSAHSSLSPTQRLSVCLLYEMGKGKASWWHPYLINLPRSYDIVATFGEFEKQALQVDDAIWAAEKAIAKAEFEWKETNALMEQLKLKPQLRTFRAWLWASATVSSRTMHIPWDRAGCLCPVGDLFNYSAPSEESDFENIEHRTHDLALEDISTVKEEASCMLDMEQLDSNSGRLTDGRFEDNLGAYSFYAKKSYRKGEQVLLSYGTYTNLELLEHYGFLLIENPNDKVFVPLEPEIYSSCSWPKESLYIHQSGKPSFTLLSALRLWATPVSQRRSVGHLAYSGHQLSIENEMFIMRWISKKCDNTMKNLPTTLKEDVFLLAVIDKIQNVDAPFEFGNLSSVSVNEICTFRATLLKKGDSEALSRKTMQRLRERWRLAIEWRLSHKKILVDCMSFCDEMIHVLSSQIVHSQR
ncbi:protein SET DOMAIN GROUP 40 [Argentina anserina]|uniref:protein SET DOMAIN GROUP 40 n=1 Tax=Argentina anserina TaxID=57926 RepID=UPI0021763390|nr:protein SET DOMAIN GROUP 40 [Potentilla anserina]